MTKKEMLDLIDVVKDRIERANRSQDIQNEKFKIGFIRSMVASEEIKTMEQMLIYIFYISSVDFNEKRFN